MAQTDSKTGLRAKAREAVGILEDAALLIERGGHCKEVFSELRSIRGREVECHCALGALSQARLERMRARRLKLSGDTSWNAHQLAQNALAVVIGKPRDPSLDVFDRIAGWNDARRRSGADVVRAMRKAAQALRSRE